MRKISAVFLVISLVFSIPSAKAEELGRDQYIAGYQDGFEAGFRAGYKSPTIKIAFRFRKKKSLRRMDISFCGPQISR